MKPYSFMITGYDGKCSDVLDEMNDRKEKGADIRIFIVLLVRLELIR